MQLQQWEIDVEYTRLEDAGDRCTIADCSVTPGYQHALVRIDPEHCTDPAGVQRALRHELLHILHADFITVFETAAEALPADVERCVRHVFHVAKESFVRRIENLLDYGLGESPQRMARPIVPGEYPNAVPVTETTAADETEASG
jgi:hypothetical protein